MTSRSRFCSPSFFFLSENESVLNGGITANLSEKESTLKANSVLSAFTPF